MAKSKINKDRKSKKNKIISERDRFTVVLESIQSDFQIFGEKLDLTDNRLERFGEKLDLTDNRLERMELSLDRIESELVDIKLEISDLKIRLSQKDDLAKLEKLERRVKRIEIILTKQGI